jgi:Trypsin-co-occurring domain 2
VEEVPLADAIEELRRQLTRAMLAGAESPMRFTVSELKLELEVAVTKSGEGHGGIKFWLVDFGAKADFSNATTHRVTLQLNPVDTEGKPVKLGDSVEVKPA